MTAMGDDDEIVQESRAGVRPIELKPVPVYPWAPISGHKHSFTEMQEGKAGITIRAHFAIRALQGLLARSPKDPGVLAMEAVDYADALVQELNKGIR